MPAKKIPIKQYRKVLDALNIGGQKRRLAEAICKYPGRTNRELEALAKLREGVVAGRCHELREIGLVIINGRKKNRDSGQFAEVNFPFIPPGFRRRSAQ